MSRYVRADFQARVAALDAGAVYCRAESDVPKASHVSAGAHGAAHKQAFANARTEVQVEVCVSGDPGDEVIEL